MRRCSQLHTRIFINFSSFCGRECGDYTEIMPGVIFFIVFIRVSLCIPLFLLLEDKDNKVTQGIISKTATICTDVYL